MKLLFWNTHKNENINKYIIELVEENEIDIVILAEYNSDILALDEALCNCKKRLERWNTIGSDRIKIWGNYIDIQPGIQNKYYSLQVVKGEYIICGVHLFSKLNGERSDERMMIANQIMGEIANLKKRIDSDKVIILGDINESPYEKTSLSALGFHGLPALRTDETGFRNLNGKMYEKMYNPMWNLFGDFNYPPGTYYKSDAIFCAPSWYMLDQVIMSQSMIKFFDKKKLKIIVQCKNETFYTKLKHPNKKISDHFPIMCGFNNI